MKNNLRIVVHHIGGIQSYRWKIVPHEITDINQNKNRLLHSLRERSNTYHHGSVFINFFEQIGGVENVGKIQIITVKGIRFADIKSFNTAGGNLFLIPFVKISLGFAIPVQKGNINNIAIVIEKVVDKHLPVLIRTLFKPQKKKVDRVDPRFKKLLNGIAEDIRFIQIILFNGFLVVLHELP